MDNYCIYYHKNKINGKYYVGLTKHGDNPSERWGSHGHRYKGNSYFYKAIQKYGWDNFTHEILFSGLSQEEAQQIEKFLIKKFDLTNHDKGYNLSEGGQCTTSPTSLKKLQEYNEERKRQIICLNTLEVFQSSHAAAQKYGCRQGNIINCCQGRCLSAGGYNWAYYEENKTYEKIVKNVKKECHKILCVQTNTIYNSARQAMRALGKNSSGGHILNACRGNVSTAYGKHWQFID